MNADEFRLLTLKHFAFLRIEFDCRTECGNAVPGFPDTLGSYETFFQNRTTGISIQFEIIERLPTVHLHRLSTVANERNIFALGLLLLVRAPGLNPLKDEVGLPLSKDVETLLMEYALALKVTGEDILRGDFSVFPDLEREWLRQVELRKAAGASKFIYF